MKFKPKSDPAKVFSPSTDRESVQSGPSGRDSLLEKFILLHVGTLLLLATWCFGGGSTPARWLISVWGSLGLAITIAGIWRRQRDEALAFPFRWLWPFLAINGLVLASAFNPSFTAKILDGESLLAYTGPAQPKLPSTVHVATSLQHLWLFDALYLSAFNLVLVRRRGALRKLLVFACGNTVALAIFGTLQKLASNGLFFGTVPSPNARFFATFIYGNHWAAIAVMFVAAGAGLLFRHARSREGDPDARGKLVLGATGLLLIAITPLIAGSRAGTFMMIALLAAFGGRAAWQFTRRRRSSAFRVSASVAVAGALIAGAALWLGRESLQERWGDTQSQWQDGLLSDRHDLYRDTWQLALRQPAFGWGLGTYSKAFQLIRSRPIEPNRQYERSYGDAHSDWLQALAEVGFVGTILFGLCVVLPARSLRASHFRSPFTTCTLLGCTLVVLYSMVEFPFGNPAVVLAWWTCFFGAVQSARLQPVPPSRARDDALLAT